MKNRYSFSESIKNIYALLVTKLFYRGARLIRRPVYIRGKRSLNYGKALTLGYSCRFDLGGESITLKIGDNCQFGDNTHIVAYESVEIGNRVLMASKVFISDVNHGATNGDNQQGPEIAPALRDLKTNQVKIGDNVWIGENVVILAGTKIGNGCIIGANSVVKGNIPENCIAVGAPAKIIKKWNSLTQSWERISGTTK